MSSASPILLNPPPPPQTPNIFSLLPASPFSLYTPHRRRPQSLTLTQTLTLLRKSSSLSPPPPLSSSFQFSPHQQQQTSIDDDEEEEHVIGDCLVFEEGAFEDPYLHQSFDSNPNKPQTKNGKASSVEIEPENLIPDKWKNVQAEINITKKQRRKIAQELEFGRRVDRKRKGLVPIRDVNLGDYVRYRDSKLSQLKPLVLDSPSFSENNEGANDGKDVNESSDGDGNPSTSSRVAPRNPRLAVYGGTLEDVSEFFSSGNYDPNAAKSEGPRKLFTKEEKVMLNRRVPDLTVAASGKWIPLHSLAASGEFYLVNTLLKHNVDINVQDNDGLTALHKSILCKKQAIFNYLLRESANPFVRDKDGATLMHYAVGTASSQMIKILLLYNVDINLQDNDGWTPLHLAVQTRRTDLVRLLLIKGADKTLENGDGLTPLDLCLYSGQDTRTYELIKLIKQLCKSNQLH